ncbi:MAG TPA: hypothetical protein VFO25_08115 [Candidatus Eremiobacteraceae bacterium]|nr:hypothetical protein [Candidatus Eremiobacteraceae bacterium]
MTQLVFKVTGISTGSRADLRAVRFEVRHDPVLPPGLGSGPLPSTTLVVDVSASTADAIRGDQTFTMPMP